MTSSKPAISRPRIGGGMNTNLGNFASENFDESVMQQAMQQKAKSQQAADPGASPTSGKTGQNKSPLSTTPETQKARPVSPKQELKWFGQDLARGLASLFDINAALGIDPVKDSPEDQAKKKQIHSRYQKLSQEEQAYVQQKYQEEMKAKQEEERQKEEAKRKKEAEENQQIQVPSSPKKGPVGPAGNKKQKATQMVNQQRQGIGRVQGAN